MKHERKSIKASLKNGGKSKSTDGKIYTVTNIKYDTDGQKVKLPKTLKITVPKEEQGSYDEIQQYISDKISNITGYLHTGFATTPEIEEMEAGGAVGGSTSKSFWEKTKELTKTGFGKAQEFIGEEQKDFVLDYIKKSAEDVDKEQKEVLREARRIITGIPAETETPFNPKDLVKDQKYYYLLEPGVKMTYKKFSYDKYFFKEDRILGKQIALSEDEVRKYISKVTKKEDGGKYEAGGHPLGSIWETTKELAKKGYKGSKEAVAEAQKNFVLDYMRDAGEELKKEQKEVLREARRIITGIPAPSEQEFNIKDLVKGQKYYYLLEPGVKMIYNGLSYDKYFFKEDKIAFGKKIALSKDEVVKYVSKVQKKEDGGSMATKDGKKSSSVKSQLKAGGKTKTGLNSYSKDMQKGIKEWKFDKDFNILSPDEAEIKSKTQEVYALDMRDGSDFLVAEPREWKDVKKNIDLAFGTEKQGKSKKKNKKEDGGETYAKGGIIRVGTNVIFDKKPGKVIEKNKEEGTGIVMVNIEYEDGTTSWEVADDDKMKIAKKKEDGGTYQQGGTTGSIESLAKETYLKFLDRCLEYFSNDPLKHDIEKEIEAVKSGKADERAVRYYMNKTEHKEDIFDKAGAEELAHAFGVASNKSKEYLADLDATKKEAGGLAMIDKLTLPALKKTKSNLDPHDYTIVLYDGDKEEFYWEDYKSSDYKDGFKTEFEAYDSLVDYLDNTAKYTEMKDGGKTKNDEELREILIKYSPKNEKLFRDQVETGKQGLFVLVGNYSSNRVLHALDPEIVKYAKENYLDDINDYAQKLIDTKHEAAIKSGNDIKEFFNK